MFDPNEYRKLINLRYSHSQLGDTESVSELDKQIADMIGDYPGPDGY